MDVRVHPGGYTGSDDGRRAADRVLDSFDDPFQGVFFSAPECEPDVVLAHGFTGAFLVCLLAVLDEGIERDELALVDAKEAFVSEEQIAGQACVSLSAGLGGWERAPTVGQDSISSGIECHQVVELFGGHCVVCCRPQ